MATYLEAWRHTGPEISQLSGSELTVGKGPANDIVINDAAVSRLHAVLEHYPSGWCIRDLGSRNGTYVNGERIIAHHVLKAGDEIRLGQTSLVFRTDARAVPGTSATHPVEAAPKLTARERDVLVALCRPVLDGNALTEPAAVEDISAALYITPDAVKKHLQRLYGKFAVTDAKPRARRARLATEALRRGAVGIGELKRS